ncbi:MAG: aminoacyl-tRNA hydrolase [Lachnospiraceae bacterium]|nr:aminoacyl-tRNA hydrolase [Lachnospiraceae bacterium]
MFVIAGLGNPGKDYEKTRHNAGFCCIDVLASRYNINIRENEHKALVGKGYIEGQKVILVKPQTYMNNSGEAIREITDYYKVDPESELLILYDDISLDVGMLRIRDKGSAGGHNGIKSIISHLGTQNFLRIKIGVGDKVPQGDLVDHVLGHFNADDSKMMKEAFEKGAEAAVMLLGGDLEKAMNIYNRKNKPQEDKDGSVL